ncbi:hypothetical protein KBY58_07640 [Cyanobium sp. HWJ4-Hawea]|nr:hypothetical protein [Cyanobium sp. HWJ4-Hawea]
MQKPALLPLLWLLPKRWKLAPAQLPPRLQTLAGVVERGLLSPIVLAALVDDLCHLLPPAPVGGQPGAVEPGISQKESKAKSALECWSQDSTLDGPLPQDETSWLAENSQDYGQISEQTQPTTPSTPRRSQQLNGGLNWQNIGLANGPSAPQRTRNRTTAQLLNRLGANLISGPQGMEIRKMGGASSSRAWMASLQANGWQVRAQLRASVASFGLGASLEIPGQGWAQVPLALPMRTGMLSSSGTEIQTLLPHSCLELQLGREQTTITLQYYQGTEGMCGWEAMNDLNRPWQNNRDNGTVRYIGECFRGEALLDLMDLCDWIALVHNQEASEHRLRIGGYGSLGFCIDSSALLQQASTGQCDLYPILLTSIWRQRLQERSNQLAKGIGEELSDGHIRAAARYGEALEQLPLDLSPQGGEACLEAKRRMRASQPLSSPFLLLQQPH